MISGILAQKVFVKRCVQKWMKRYVNIFLKQQMREQELLTTRRVVIVEYYHLERYWQVQRI